jgi:integrase
MNRLDVGPVAKNNHRRLIVALFNFGKAHGWLRKDEATAAEALGATRVKKKDVEIYTPEELGRLLSAADDHFLPWIALIAFGGLRREELAKGLPWEAIDFQRGCIIVPAAIAKTNRKRKIDMPDNLREWLEPYRGRTGAIFPTDPRKRTAKLLAVVNVGKMPAERIKWKRNGLRHSFGSYRTEQTKNFGLVAMEMGNSAKVVQEHYFELVHAEAAQAYWNLRPALAGKIVQLRASAA